MEMEGIGQGPQLAGACLAYLRNSDFGKTVMLKLHILGRWLLDEFVLPLARLILDSLTSNQIQSSFGNRRSNCSQVLECWGHGSLRTALGKACELEEIVKFDAKNR